MELTTTPDARRYRLLRHLRGAGRPVRVETLLDADHADPDARRAVAEELRDLEGRGLIQATPYGWLWRESQ